jgi:hypothetical protein
MQAQTLTLNEKQRFAFYSPATEILYGGAAGGGKSLFLRLSAIRWCSEIPGIQVYIFRRTFPDLRDNHLRGPTSFHIFLAGAIQSGEVKYLKQENEFVWVKTGSRIKLCHCQHEDDVQNYQGAEIHVLIIDELTHFTDYQYRFLRGRVRCIGLNIPSQYKDLIPRIETGSNPGSVGHGWVKNSFIHDPMKIWKAPADEGGMMRQYIPARLSDNPDLVKADPNYEARLDGLGDPALVRAMKEGDWDIFAGQFFSQWRRDIHVIEPFEIPQWWNRFGGYDHGFNHPYMFGGYAVSDDGDVFKYRECGGRGRTPDQIIEEINAVAPEFIAKKHTIYAGHDLWVKGRDGSPEIVERFHGKLSMIKAHIDRVTGADQLRNYLDWRKNEHGEFTKKPRLYVFKNCIRTINQIPAMVYDDKRPEDVLKVNATENDPWCGDDAYDETRYAMMSRPRISKEPTKSLEKDTYGYLIQQEINRRNQSTKLRYG